MLENKTDRFLEILNRIRREGVRPEDIHTVRRCLLDYLGATVGGSVLLGERGAAVLDSLDSSGGCSVIGYGRSASQMTAAFVNGLSSHTAELDDGVISGIIHPGAPVFSALLAVAEEKSVEFKDFCRGVLIGYEASVRLSNAIQPSHKKLGYHASATCGLIGAALGIAAMLRYGEKSFHDTFCVAAASSHGTLKVLEDDSELKPFNIATAASDGLIAAVMGKVGFTGPLDPLEGYAGFMAQFTAEANYEELYRERDLCINDVYVKPYAACRYVHPTIENALRIIGERTIDPAEISSVDIRTYSLAVKNHDHTVVNNISSAKMSIPFGAAVAFVNGTGGIEAYTDITVSDDRIKALMRKVSVMADAECSAMFPDRSMAYMTVKMRDGNVYEAFTDQPKGESTAPLTDDELIEKFRSLARYAGMTEHNAEAIIREIFSSVPDIKTILRIMRK